MFEQRGSRSVGYGSFPLAQASEGETVRIAFVRGGRKKEERLMAMGLKIGDSVQVQLSKPDGGKVVRAGGTRYALDKGVSQSIIVVNA